MKIAFLLFGLLLFSNQALGRNQCAPIFAHAFVESDAQAAARIVALVETDRARLAEARSGQTVTNYLRWLLMTQHQQLNRISDFGSRVLSRSLLAHFQSLIRRSIEINKTVFDDVQSHHNSDSVPMRTFGNLNDSVADFALNNKILNMMIRTNSQLAEMTAAIRYPEVIMTETTLDQIVAQSRVSNSSIDELLISVGRKKMDLVSRDGDWTLWIEVKYLGRHKEYDQASGPDISYKMIMAQQIADLMPNPTRAVLVIVGPGRLMDEAEAVYTNNRIEVVYLTPDMGGRRIRNILPPPLDLPAFGPAVLTTGPTRSTQ